MKHNIDWSKSCNGVMLCSFEDTIKFMPEVEPILNELHPILELDKDQYVVDVKIHMLMPKQWPCIPNWHRDFLPRDEQLVRNPRGITGEEMYMWISGAPLTEYMDDDKNVFTKPAQQWHTFTQHDIHRGTMCEEHTWRCFIRVIPKKFVHAHTTNVGEKRQHIQVYCDPKTFNW